MTDVIRDDEAGAHGYVLSSSESVIAVSIATQVAPELSCLHVEHTPVGHLVFELRMSDLGVEPPKPGAPELASTGVGEVAAFGGLGEIVRTEFLAVEEGEGDRVSDQGTEFFHEVEGESGSTVARLMEESDEGVETHGVTDTSEFFGEDGVTLREESIEWVAWRAAIAAIEVEALTSSSLEHGGKVAKVEGGGAPFVAAESVEGVGLGAEVTEFGELFKNGVGSIAITHEEDALVVNLDPNDFASKEDALREVLEETGLA